MMFSLHDCLHFSTNHKSVTQTQTLVTDLSLSSQHQLFCVALSLQFIVEAVVVSIIGLMLLLSLSVYSFIYTVVFITSDSISVLFILVGVFL